MHRATDGDVAVVSTSGDAFLVPAERVGALDKAALWDVSNKLRGKPDSAVYHFTSGVSTNNVTYVAGTTGTAIFFRNSKSSWTLLADGS